MNGPPLNESEFATWLSAKLTGHEKAAAVFPWATVAEEMINGKLRPAVIVGTADEAMYVISVARVAP